MIWSLPTGSAVVVKVAVPLVRFPDPMTFPPRLKLTDPVGVAPEPLAEATVAVSVIEVPAEAELADVFSVVVEAAVVAAGATSNWKPASENGPPP